MDVFKRIISCDTVPAQSTTSIEIFYRWFLSTEGRDYLLRLSQDSERLSRLAGKFTNANETDSLWLYLTLQCFPGEGSIVKLQGESDEDVQKKKEERLECLKVIQELCDAFDAAVRVPSGLRLKHAVFGNCHINVSSIANIETSSKVAVRLLLVLIERSLGSRGGAVVHDEQTLAFLRKRLLRSDGDSMTSMLVIRTCGTLLGLTFDVQNDYKVRSISMRSVISTPLSWGHLRGLARDFLDIVFDSLVALLASYEVALGELRVADETLFKHKEVVSDLTYAYECLLTEICKVDKEEDLLVPIGSYLRDHENLRLARVKHQKACEKLIKLEADMLVQKESLAHMLPGLCMIVLLCTYTASLTMYESESAFPPPIDPSLVEEGRKDEEKMNEAGRRQGNKQAVKEQLDKVPWNESYSNLISLERMVYGSNYTRLLACLACRWFVSYQEKLSVDERLSRQEVEAIKLKEGDHVAEERGGSFYRRSSLLRQALNDLANPELLWRYEALSDKEEEWTPRTRRTLHRPLRRLTADTRVTTALVYWAGRNNPLVANKLLHWRPQLSEPVDDVSSPRAMWKRLVLRSGCTDGDAGAFDVREDTTPPYEREYKEYTTTIADSGLIRFLQSDYTNILERHSSEEQGDDLSDGLQMCMDRKASLYFGVAYSRHTASHLLVSDHMGLEGTCEFDSLRGNHPLGVVLLLLEQEATAESAAFEVATGCTTEKQALLPSLVQVARRTHAHGQAHEDYLLHCLALQALSSVISGRFPVHRNPSRAQLFRDRDFFPSEGFRSGFGSICCREELLGPVLSNACNVLYSEAIGHLCPLGVQDTSMLSAALRYVAAAGLLLPSAEVAEHMIQSCVAQFDNSRWNAATIGDYKVQKEKERKERRRKNAERERNMRARAGSDYADEGGTAVVEGAEVEDHESVSEAALQRQGQVSFITPFLFLLKHGLIHGLVSRILEVAQWHLPDETVDMLLVTLGKPSSALAVRCDYLELFNVLLLGEVPLPLTEQANFLAGAFLSGTNLDTLEWPSLDDLMTSEHCCREKHPRLLHLRIRGQLLKMSCHIVSSGRAETKPPGQPSQARVGEGEGNLPSISHTSLANEYVLYVALSEEGDSLHTASSILSYCSRYLESAIHQQEGQLASCDGDGRTVFADSAEYVLKPELDAAALEDVRREQSRDQLNTLMLDTLFLASEFLTQVCNKRLELQSVVAQNCAPLFFTLPSLAAPPSLPLSSGLFHVGLAVRISDLIGVLAYRHEECISLILESGCIEALFRGLEECCETIIPSRAPTRQRTASSTGTAGGLLPPPSGSYPAHVKKKWSLSITNTLQIIVSRDVRAWEYCQQCSGIGGVFKIIQLGNDTIKKLCVSTLLDHSVNADTGKNYIANFVETGGLVLATRLLREPLADIVVGTLRVLKVVIVESYDFRTEVLTRTAPQGQAFLLTLTDLFGRPQSELEIRTSICRILDILCAQDAPGLRSLLDSAGNMVQLLMHFASSHANGGGEEVKADHSILASACARTLGNLTNSEESDFLTQGGTPLRATLLHSGILPEI